MADDFYPFVDSGDPAPDNSHLGGAAEPAPETDGNGAGAAVPADASTPVAYATRIAVYDDLLSTPRVIVIEPRDVRSYLEEVTNTVYRVMKEQGGRISLMVIREIVENFIHAHFVEPVISVLDDGNTLRFADQGPGIEDKDRAFEFGVTSADRAQKRYIRGTGAGLPMVQQYLENAGGAVSVEDNLNQGTVVTVSVDEARVAEITATVSRGAAVRGAAGPKGATNPGAPHPGAAQPTAAAMYPAAPGSAPQPVPEGTNPQLTDASPYPAAATWQGAGTAYPVQQGVAAPAPYGAPYPPATYQMTPYGAPYPVAYPGYPPYQAAPAQQPGYPQPGHEFSTTQQYPLQPAETAPSAAGAAPTQQEPFVSERGVLALSYLREHGSCGPTDLAGAYGSSAPTWSRELDTLAGTGLVVKRGQKRYLTELGEAWAQRHA